MCLGYVRSVLRTSRRRNRLERTSKRSTRDSLNEHYQLDYRFLPDSRPMGRSHTNIYVLQRRPIPEGVVRLLILYVVIMAVYTVYLYTLRPPSLDHNIAMDIPRSASFVEYASTIPRECRDMNVMTIAPPATQYKSLVWWLRTNPFFPLVSMNRVEVITDLCALLCRPESIQANVTFFVYATDPLERMVRHIRKSGADTDYVLKDIDLDLDCILNGQHPVSAKGTPKDYHKLNVSNCVKSYCYFRHAPKKQLRLYLLVWGMTSHLYAHFRDKSVELSPVMAEEKLYINYREGTVLDTTGLAEQLYTRVHECWQQHSGHSVSYESDPVNAENLYKYAFSVVMHAKDSPSSDENNNKTHAGVENIEDVSDALGHMGIPKQLETHLQDFYSIHKNVMVK